MEVFNLAVELLWASAFALAGAARAPSVAPRKALKGDPCNGRNGNTLSDWVAGVPYNHEVPRIARLQLSAAHSKGLRGINKAGAEHQSGAGLGRLSRYFARSVWGERYHVGRQRASRLAAALDCP